MSYSQGNIIFKANMAGGGGGILTADNGLTLIGTNVQLGGILIKDTVIDLSIFTLDVGYSSGNNARLLLDNGNYMGAPFATMNLYGNPGLYVVDNGFDTYAILSNVANFGVSDVNPCLAWTGIVALRQRNFGFDANGDLAAIFDPTGANLHTFTIFPATGEIQTGFGSSKFKFNNVFAGAVAFDAANYVEVFINGIAYKLALAT